MSNSVYTLGAVVVIFTFVFYIFAIGNTTDTQLRLSRSTKAANELALDEIREKYNTGNVISTQEMMEAWLSSFIGREVLSLDDLTLNFVQVSTDPPTFLVYAEGYTDKAAFISESLYKSYRSGGMLIER